MLLLTSTSASWAGDWPEIARRGKLRVVIGAELPEWFAVGQYSQPGFERELFEGFTRLHGLELEVVSVKRQDQRIPTLLEGAGDVIGGIGVTPERQRQIAFTSGEILPVRQVVVTRTAAQVEKPEELRSRRVGVVMGTAVVGVPQAAGVPSSQVKSFENVDGVLRALRANEIDACVLPLMEAIFASKADREVVVGIPVGPSASLAWGVRKQDAELRKLLDEHLANVRRSGIWARLVVKYFGDRALQILGK
jgi:ABC-type amino acid transport substrate-binding protein